MCDQYIVHACSILAIILARSTEACFDFVPLILGLRTLTAGTSSVYQFGTSGKAACPVGYEFISSITDCKLAANALIPGRWRPGTKPKDYGTKHPKGCFYDGKHTSGKNVFFNSGAGGGAATSQDMTICKRTFAEGVLPIYPLSRMILLT